jgi:hypothetical protein
MKLGVSSGFFKFLRGEEENCSGAVRRNSLGEERAV